MRRTSKHQKQPTATGELTPGQIKYFEDLKRRVVKRDDLLQRDKVSLPSEMGILSVIVSGATGPKYESDDQIARNYAARMAEAEQIADDRAGTYGDIVIRPRATQKVLIEDLRNPEVSDMVLIGHGSIARFWLDRVGEGSPKDFSWLNVAHSITALKTGKFEQRMCGHFANSTHSVPLGTFAVTHFSNVLAPVGAMVEAPNGTPRDHLFVPVFNDHESVLSQIDQLNALHAGIVVTRR
jgi:hypothetical protein